MTATRRSPAQPVRDDLAVAAELAVIREIVTRLETKIDAMELKVDGHATQIDRWRTAGKIIAPLLIGLGAALANVLDDALLWLAKAVKA